MKKVFIISLCVMLALSCVAVPVTVYASSFSLPFEEGTVYIEYTTADYAPSGSVTAYGGLMYFSEVSGISPLVLLKSYSCYQVVAEKIICINYYGGGYGYILWKDSNGDYQHLMWTIEATETVFDLDIDSTSAAPAELTGEEFADIISRLNEQYAPSTIYYISAETDKRWTTNNTGGVMSFFADGVFCNQSNWLEVYCLPFYRDGDEIYYSLYQSHFKQRLETGEDGTNSIYLDVDWLFNADHSVASSTTIYSEQSGSPLINLANIRYMDYTFVFSGSHNRMYTYSSYSNYVQKKGEMYAAALDYDNANSPYLLYKVEDIENSDFSSSINMLSVSSNLSDTIEKGLYVSNEPITLGVNWTGIDSNKIDPDAIVKMDGDTFYDYSITNTSGDTTTINEYVTNNYTYITNNDGGSDGGSSSGGSVSGDVNVKGEIAVGGQVDINVNVNDDSDTSFDFLLPADQYAEYLPDVAPEVTEYLERTYSFLPPEVVGLLIGGIGAAVLCRILGR